MELTNWVQIKHFMFPLALMFLQNSDEYASLGCCILKFLDKNIWLCYVTKIDKDIVWKNHVTITIVHVVKLLKAYKSIVKLDKSQHTYSSIYYICGISLRYFVSQKTFYSTFFFI